jgi:5-methylcytosine-specific restriction endonuclease McrA
VTNRVLPLYPARQDRGPGGRLLCRVCGTEVKGRRRTFCSQACVDRYLLAVSWPHVVARVKERDHGVCRTCGLACDLLERVLGHIRYSSWAVTGEQRLENQIIVRAVREALGLRATGSTWETHHVVERKRGGTDGLSNLITLCQKCHAEETKRFAAERARQRREAKPLPLFSQAERGPDAELEGHAR